MKIICYFILYSRRNRVPNFPLYLLTNTFKIFIEKLKRMISYLGYMQAVMLPPLCSIVYKFLEGRFMTLVGTFSLNIL